MYTPLNKDVVFKNADVELIVHGTASLNPDKS